jgi:hypothetical protein
MDMYQRLSGTSMAVPHVSGSLARIWADFPNCKADVVRKSIEETAKDLGPAGKDPLFGYGLLQAESAYEWLSRQPCAKAGFTTERGQKQTYEQSREGQQQRPAQQQAQQQKQQEQRKRASDTSSSDGGWR